MKHLAFLSILFYLAACVQGEQKVHTTSAGAGATAPSEITQTTTPGSPPALPIPSNLAFTSTYCNSTFCPDNQYPFLRTTQATLTVDIFNPSNLPFTLEWSVNDGTPTIINNPTQSSILIDGSSTILFPVVPDYYTIQSKLKDSLGVTLSNLIWSVEIAGTNPVYGSFSPSPSPTPYVGSPFSKSNNTLQTVTATISNPSLANFKNNWYLDGVLQSTTDQTGPTTVSYSFTPSSLAIGNHTIVSQLTGNPATSTIYNTATWSFEVTNLPQFSTFTDPQLPSPAPFPDIEFGTGGLDILLDPNPLYNPGLLNWTLVWELDGAIDSTATCNGGGACTPSGNPDPFLIDPDNATETSVGRHSVVALLYDNSSSTPTLVDSVSWNYEVVFPPPATLVGANPATSTQIISVSTIPMDGTSPMGGFFIGPSTDDSRGTPMVVVLPVSSTNTFCVTVDNAGGVGVGYAYNSSGVTVQYRYSDGTRINPNQLQYADRSGNPATICLDGTGAATPTNGVPNFTLSTLGDTFITATISDKLSLQEIAEVRWNITVAELNTPPTLTVLGPTPFSTSTTANVYQDQAYTYTFTVKDQDCHPADSKLNCYTSEFSFQSPGQFAVALNGTNTYYPVWGANPPGPSTPLTPDCWRDFNYSGSDKFSCTVTIPSNNGTAPIPASGTFKITAEVTNSSIWVNASPVYSATSTFYDPVTSKIELTWDLTVLEANNGTPTLQNPKFSGTATPTINSYIYLPVDSFTIPSAATESDSILFNLVVDDLEKDNYKIELLHNTSTATGTFISYATPTYTYAIGDNPVNGVHPASATLVQFVLPYELVTGVQSATITFRVQLTDVPDSASVTGKTSTLDFPLTVFNLNPAPATGTLEPALDSTGTVMQGFPYTFTSEITDNPPGFGSNLVWQWMINQEGATECASQTAVSWKKITGANEGGTPLAAPQTATLTWSPPSLQISGIPTSTPFCFRNCIGDDDYPGLNTTTCTPTMAGPWNGGILGASADRESASAGDYQQANRGDTAVWADTDPSNEGTIYGVHVRDNFIYLMKYIYNLDTTITQESKGFPTAGTDTAPNASSTEGAYDLSVTGNSQFIFVSYVYNSESFFPPYVSIPTNTVARIAKASITATSTVDYFINERIPAGVGQIVANNSAFWVPFINSSGGNLPFYFAGDGASAATTTINGSFGLPLTANEIESREQGGALFMALKLDDGSVNLYRYTLPASISSPTLSAKNEDIFSNYFVPFTDMSLAVGGTPTNPNVFVAGIDTSTKAIFYGVKPIIDLANGQPFTVPDISSATAIYPKTSDPKGLNAIASTNPGEVLLGFIKEESTLRSPFAELYILKSDGTNLNLSKRINQNKINLTSPGIYNGNDFALTNVTPKFEIGNHGADTNENKKDTLWFRYFEFSGDRMVIINIEDETFSGSTPIAGTSTATTGSAWSDPWFTKP